MATMRSEASGLQGPRVDMRIRWMTGGLLAVMGLSACGVGVDDPQGQAAAGVTQQAVYVTQDGNVLAYTTQTTAQTTAAPSAPGGTNELPQDPVPVHGGSPTVIVVKPEAVSGAMAK